MSKIKVVLHKTILSSLTSLSFLLFTNAQVSQLQDIGFSYSYAVYKDSNSINDYDAMSYAIIYDNYNYKLKINDEFEKNKYLKEMKGKLIEKIQKVNFLEHFLTSGKCTFEEYNFDSKSFPINFLKPQLNYYSDCDLSDPVNLVDFDFNLYLEEYKAKELISKLKDYQGNIKRQLYYKMNYTITKRKGYVRDISSTGDLIPYIYHIDFFEDANMTQKIATIKPMKDYHDKINCIKLWTGFDTTYFKSYNDTKDMMYWKGITFRKNCSYFKVCCYSEGKVIDVKLYYASGELYRDGAYLPSDAEWGIPDGMVNYYWKNGIKSNSYTYINGELEGCEFQWNEDGKCDFFSGARMNSKSEKVRMNGKCNCTNQ